MYTLMVDRRCFLPFVLLTAAGCYLIPTSPGNRSARLDGPEGTTQQEIILTKNGLPHCTMPSGTRYKLDRVPPTILLQGPARPFNSIQGPAYPFKILEVPESMLDNPPRPSSPPARRGDVRPSVPVVPLAICEKNYRNHVPYAWLVEPADPDYWMSLPNASLSVYGRTDGTSRVQMKAAAFSASTRPGWLVDRLDVVFILLAGDSTIVRGGELSAQFVDVNFGDPTPVQNKSSVVVTATELATANYLIFGKRTCRWGVIFGKITWFENCYEANGRLKEGPGRGAPSMQMLARRFVKSNLSTLRNFEGEPGQQFSLAGWKVLPLR